MPLVKRGNSKFWYVQFQLNKQTFIRSTRTTDRKAAERLETQFRAEVHAEGILGKKRTLTLEAALTRFIATKEGTPNYKNLLVHRRSVLRILAGSISVEALRSDDLETFKRRRLEEGCAAQTIKHGLNLIMSALRSAKRSGFDVPDLYAPTIKIANSKLRYLSLNEEARLLAELDPDREGRGLAPRADRSPRTIQAMRDNYDLVVMLLDTGARYNEIARLSWDQIDLEARTIRLWRSKVGNESVLFMTKRVAGIVANRAISRSTKSLFSNSKGGARGYRVIAIRKAFQRAGLLDCTVHTLRHTHASRLIQNGMSVYEVKAILGHADIRTTMRYAHLEQVAVSSKARDVMERMATEGRR